MGGRLGGGAGATTLAYLVALAAAEQDHGPVLVADTGGPSGGLAALAGVETSHSLVELAAQIAGHRPLGGGVYATGPSGVRVLATAPEFRTIGTHEQLMAQGGYYAVMTWLPTFLRTERGLSILDSTGYLAVLISGSFCGYLSGGFLADRIGRRFVLRSRRDARDECEAAHDE